MTRAAEATEAKITPTDGKRESDDDADSDSGESSRSSASSAQSEASSEQNEAPDEPEPPLTQEAVAGSLHASQRCLLLAQYAPWISGVTH